MKSISKTILSMLTAMLIVLPLLGTSAKAATPNYSIAVPGVQTIPLQLSGQYIATVAGVVRFALPFKAQVIGVTCSARVSGGTSPTLTVDVKDDGASILSAPVSVTAGAVSEGAITNAVVSDESVVTVDLAITGTSPTWDDITVLITVVRL